ncbi:MAG: site-specific DNA-methyltransferase [Bacteroidetes bacterium]|nr:site-specific DNA-methyltransferase [Bacteroidota bacterium]
MANIFEKNKTYLGDCLEIMPTFPDGIFDMILCDLPYGTTACKWDAVIPFDKMVEQYERILKPNGICVLFGQEPFSSVVRTTWLSKYKYDWKWNKRNGGNPFLVKKRPIINYEDVMIFGTPKSIYNYQIDKTQLLNKLSDRKAEERESEHFNNYKWNNKRNVGYPKAIIDFKTTQWQKEHPTQKPIELCEYLIKTYTNENELILDNCAGSGTTGIACMNTNRNYVMIEKEEKYFDLILKRVKKNILIKKENEAQTSLWNTGSCR